MRYIKVYQTKADEFAKENGYFCALYYGARPNCLVFMPFYEDTMPRIEGLPAVIVVYDDGSAELVIDMLSFELLSDTHRRDFVLGRKLFRRIEEIAKNNMGEEAPKDIEYHTVPGTVI